MEIKSSVNYCNNQYYYFRNLGDAIERMERNHSIAPPASGSPINQLTNILVSQRRMQNTLT